MERYEPYRPARRRQEHIYLMARRAGFTDSVS